MRDSLAREDYNLNLRREKFEAEVDAEAERLVADTKKHYEQMEKINSITLVKSIKAETEKVKEQYDTYRKEKEGLFNIVSVIAIITAVFSACTREVFWGDFKDFWVNGTLLVAKAIKSVCMAFWGVVVGVYERVPYTALDVIVAGLVFVVIFGAIPFTIYLVVKIKGKDFWKWYKGGLTATFVTIISCVLLMGMFWGKYTIKKLLPWWNLWGMWILFAILFSFLSAWWYKDNPRYY